MDKTNRLLKICRRMEEIEGLVLDSTMAGLSDLSVELEEYDRLEEEWDALEVAGNAE